MGIFLFIVLVAGVVYFIYRMKAVSRMIEEQEKRLQMEEEEFLKKVRKEVEGKES